MKLLRNIDLKDTGVVFEMAALLFFLILIMTSSGNARYEERDFFRKQGPRESCQRRYSCAKSPSSHIPVDYLVNLNCYCDDLCQTYDDCCEDYKPKNDSDFKIVHLPTEVISCQNEVQYEFTSELSVYVVNHCPRAYNQNEIRKRCHLGLSNSSKVIYRFPVSGKMTKILYRNYYCAICNNDADVTFWNAALLFDYFGQDSLEYQQTFSNVSSGLPITLNDLRFNFPEGYVLRPCKSVIRHCRPDWVGHSVAEKCENRSQLNAFVYDKSDTHPLYRRAFRNKDCALCNNLKYTTVGCDTFRYDYPGKYILSEPPPAISFDLNSKSASGARFIRGKEKTIEKFPECKSGLFYDPFSAECLEDFKEHQNKDNPIAVTDAIQNVEINASSAVPFVTVSVPTVFVLSSLCFLINAVVSNTVTFK